MRVIGLTGSIGMGKSTAAAMLRASGMPVHDADRCVHRLLAPRGEAVAAVERAFPGTRGPAGGIDRKALGARVFGDPARLRALEGILHPLVRRAEQRFLAAARRQRRRAVVLDVPLLLETDGDQRCDLVLVVAAPPFLQAQRVLRRPGMTPARLAAIRSQQMPESEKRRRADVVVPTGLGRRVTFDRLRRALRR
ncbi:MAG: dephospho-CoA kinase [Alphaproteobacteria bacterium]|nr:dephospho-CoA kinase [Alphaproteobacteria bacterium]